MLDRIHNDEGKVIRTAFNVTHQRVQHYDDVVEYMARDAVNRYKAKYHREPSKESIDFLKKELVRYAVIRRDIETAQKLEIQESRILNETNHLYPRLQQHT